MRIAVIWINPYDQTSYGKGDSAKYVLFLLFPERNCKFTPVTHKLNSTRFSPSYLTHQFINRLDHYH